MSITLNVSVSLEAFKAIQDASTLADALDMFKLGTKAADHATESVVAFIKAVKDVPFEVTAKKTTAGEDEAAIDDTPRQKAVSEMGGSWSGWQFQSYPDSVVSDHHTNAYKHTQTSPPALPHWPKPSPKPLKDTNGLLNFPTYVPKLPNPFLDSISGVKSKNEIPTSFNDHAIAIILDYDDQRSQTVQISPYALVSDLLMRRRPWIGDVKLTTVTGKIIAFSRNSLFAQSHTLKEVGINDGDVILVKRDKALDDYSYRAEIDRYHGSYMD